MCTPAKSRTCPSSSAVPMRTPLSSTTTGVTGERLAVMTAPVRVGGFAVVIDASPCGDSCEGVDQVRGRDDADRTALVVADEQDVDLPRVHQRGGVVQRGLRVDRPYHPCHGLEGQRGGAEG